MTNYVALIRSRAPVLVVLAPRPTLWPPGRQHVQKTRYRVGVTEVTELDFAFRRETPQIGMWIDSSEQEAPETVQAIVDRAHELGQIK
jgi:hypothetical protein